MNVAVDSERLRRYLLGELPEEESAALEERYFGTDDVFAAVLAAEDELAEEYLRGGLSIHDRERFERRFLSTPDGRRRLGIVRDVAGRAPSARWRAAARPLEPVRWVAAAAVLASVVAGWSLIRDRHRHPAVAGIAPRAGLPETSVPDGAASPHAVTSPAPPPPGPAEAVLSVTLVAGLAREPGAGMAFEIPVSTSTVRLRLLLPSDGYERYRVSLQTPEGSERASYDGLAPRGKVPRRRIDVLVPAVLLAPGTYVAIVSGLAADGRLEAASEYVFRVTRPARSAAPAPATRFASPDHM